MPTLRPLKAIRSQCIDCSGGIRKMVAYCPCDGHNSTRCELWPYRFGMRPETAKAEYGVAMMTPSMMPDSSVEIETLPNNPRDYIPQKGNQK